MSAYICLTQRVQLTFLHAEWLMNGGKDILKIRNHSDTHMDFGVKDANTHRAG
jgi:hypothetical protein